MALNCSGASRRRSHCVCCRSWPWEIRPLTSIAKGKHKGCYFLLEVYCISSNLHVIHVYFALIGWLPWDVCWATRPLGEDRSNCQTASLHHSSNLFKNLGKLSTNIRSPALAVNNLVDREENVILCRGFPWWYYSVCMLTPGGYAACLMANGAFHPRFHFLREVELWWKPSRCLYHSLSWHETVVPPGATFYQFL